MIEMKSGLKWSYLGDGTWEAASARAGLMWRVQVRDTGSFDISKSDRELTTPTPWFSSLEDAQDWCDGIEDKYLARESAKVWVVWTRPPHLHSEDPSLCVGVYSTLGRSLEVVRGLMGDEWDIREHLLDTLDPGQVIWAHDCYHENGEQRETMRGFYRRHWPNGYPD